MPKPVKLVLVSAEHHPLHKMWVKVLEQLAGEEGLEKEIRLEDYVYLTEHGETDELGMSWLPQLLVEFDDGSVKPLLSEMPIGANYKADPEKAVEEARRRLKELSS